MKLKRIELTDFRPFFGEQYLDFSEDPVRNVTLVHAQNGQGKTTLLNALLWAFHGVFTPNFREQDLLVNKEAMRLGRDVCKVEVLFTHEGKQYRVARSYHAPSRKSTFNVYIVEANGALRPHPQQNAFIELVFPRQMAGYFFFDGEYAENFSNSTRQGAVHQSIKRILGCTAAELGLEDLAKLESRVHRQIRETTGNTQVRELEDRRAQLEGQAETAEQSLKDVQQARDLVLGVLKEIDRRLSEIAASATLQKQLERAQQALKVAKARRNDLLQQRARWLTEGATFVVSARLSADCERLLSEATRKAEIPAPYNEQFVKTLLHKEECICGRPLAPGSPEMAKVSSLLSSAAESETLRRLVRVTAFTQTVARRGTGANRELARLEQELARAIDDIASLDHEVRDLDKRLSSSPLAEVAERQRQRGEKNKELAELSRAEDQLKESLQESRSEIRRLDAELVRRRAEDKTLARLSKRLEFLKSGQSSLEGSLKHLQQEALQSIALDTNKIMASILRKAYTARITDDYSVSLLDENGQPVPASSGESQLLSLSFLASLIRFCASRQNSSETLLTPGTVAPFVLDSPFGQLDPLYRVGAARFLPKFADQVVLLVSASQGDSQVLAALRPAIGSESALVQHNSSQRSEGDDAVETIRVDGEEVRVTVWDSAPTRTEILNIRYYGES